MVLVSGGGRRGGGEPEIKTAKAQDPLQSQAAWVKRRRTEVNKIASSADTHAPGQPDAKLPAEAKKAIDKLKKTVS